MDNNSKTEELTPRPMNGESQESSIDLGFDQEDLLALLHDEMPFGRFRGCPLIDLPEDYLLWFERREFPPGNLGRLMKLSLGVKRYGADQIVKRLRQLG